MGGYWNSGYWGGYFNPEAPINAINSVAETEQIYPYAGVEPLSLEDAKLYCKIDYDEDDNLLLTLITAARLLLEKYTGLSFVQKRLIVQLTNLCGGIELPYGPIPGGPAAIDKTLVTDGAGNAIDEGLIVLTGISYGNIGTFVNVQSPCYPLLEFIYSAGYPQLPETLLTAMKAQVFFMYENRGELQGTLNEGGGRGYSPRFVCDAAKVLCENYIRVSNMTM